MKDFQIYSLEEGHDEGTPHFPQEWQISEA
jgi:hypothetical protein